MPTGDLTSPPGPGWWQASDGHWYAPELHPDNIGRPVVAGAGGRGTVTRGVRGLNGKSHVAGQNRNGGHVNGNGYGTNGYGNGLGGRAGDGAAANGRPMSGVPLSGTPLGGAPESAPGRVPASGAGVSSGSVSGVPLSGAQAGGRLPNDHAGNGQGAAANGRLANMNARTVNGGPLYDYSPRAADREPGGNLDVAAAGRPVTTIAGTSGQQVASAPPGLSLAAPGSGRPLGNLPFDPLQDPATLLGEWEPQAPSPSRPPVAPPAGGIGNGGPARPAWPGFDRTSTPPPGSTVRQQLPQTPYRPRAQGQLPRNDGFDEWLESFAVEPAVRPARTVQPVHRSPHRDATTGGRSTIGGPQTAPARISNREADFFVLKPASKSPKHKARATARRRLSAALFFAVVLIVLAGGTIAVLYIHAHPH